MISKWSIKTVVTLLLLVTLYVVPTPKAQAFEPISMSIVAAILLPYAIQFAKAAAPYVLKGATNFAGAMVDVGMDMAEMILLPFGMCEASFGYPMGLFSLGTKHMGMGCVAPFKAMWSMMKVPVRIFTG